MIKVLNLWDQYVEIKLQTGINDIDKTWFTAIILIIPSLTRYTEANTLL